MILGINIKNPWDDSAIAKDNVTTQVSIPMSEFLQKRVGKTMLSIDISRAQMDCAFYSLFT